MATNILLPLFGPFSTTLIFGTDLVTDRTDRSLLFLLGPTTATGGGWVYREYYFTFPDQTYFWEIHFADWYYAGTFSFLTKSDRPNLIRLFRFAELLGRASTLREFLRGRGPHVRRQSVWRHRLFGPI